VGLKAASLPLSPVACVPAGSLSGEWGECNSPEGLPMSGYSTGIHHVSKKLRSAEYFAEFLI